MPISFLYTAIGFLLVWCYIAFTVWNVIEGIRVHWLPKFTHSKLNLVEKFGAWAVITGATDGIGKAYTMELAKRGMSIVLISKTSDLLKLTADEIRQTYKVDTKIIQADFSQGFSAYDHIEKELEDIPVGILVNNVGMFFSHPLYFSEVPARLIEAIVNININTTLLMTRIVLAGMQKRRKGAVVFMSSICELSSHPLNTLYSSTKRFIRSFCEGLEPDCESHGITVQRLTPAFIQGSLSTFAKTAMLGTWHYMIPSADTYARHAVDTLGRINVTTGYWPHSLQYFVFNNIPLKLLTFGNEYFAVKVKRNYLRKHIIV